MPDEAPKSPAVASDDDVSRLLAFTDTRRPGWEFARLDTLLLDQAARTPRNVAVDDGTTVLTYAEFIAEAESVAARLRAAGLGPDDVVAICADRCTALPVAMAGVLLAGAAYLPLDPTYPVERLRYMLDESGSPVLLAEQRYQQLVAIASAGTAVASLDARGLPADSPKEERAPSPDQLAYVIYTSGSTGRPKGVAIPHRGVVNRLLWMQEEYALANDDVVLQKTPYTFDVSVWEFFWPLVTGARLVMAPPGAHLDPESVLDVVRTQHVTTIHFVPSMLVLALNEPALGDCTSLRRVFCSGESLPPAVANRFRECSSAPLYNLYGPTEVSIDVTHWTCTPVESGTSVPIGRPIANTLAFVLDPVGRLVPVGHQGELYLGGAGLARGYLARPDLTAERFVAVEVRGQRHRLYRTGDQVRWRDDGVLEFLGRLDGQVKLHGFRIELGEIESLLLEHEAVSAAAVVVRSDLGATPKLVAYAVARGEPQLISYLAERVPSYMVPSHLVFVASLPLTPHGKLDRAALPLPPRRRLAVTRV